MRSNVLRIYRHMIRTAKQLPPGKRVDAENQIREGFRRGIKETDENIIQNLLRDAQSRLSYVKMVTPKEISGQGGVTRLMYSNGKMTEIEKSNEAKARKPISNWTGRNLDPDSVNKHRRNLSRAGFRDHQHVVGPHGF